MAIRRRAAKAKGAASAAPASSRSNIKRREIPKTSVLSQEGSELAELVTKIKAAGDYGDTFYIANNKRFHAPILSTGVLGVDLPFGGGFAMGRASMVVGEKHAGKSTLATMAIARLHKNEPDAVAVIVDVEGTYDTTWAAKLGADLDRLVIVEPESGEHAVDLADAVLRAKEVRIVVTDSIAMLVPMKEVEASASQDFIGLQARLIGKYIRRTTQAMVSERKRNHYVSLMHINQFRMKAGLCFGYSSKVVLADGSKIKIGQIVNQRLSVDVLTYNELTGEIEPKKVVEWHNNGRVEQFLHLTFDGGKNGHRQMLVTPEHKIFTPRGEVSAADLKVDDEVLVRDLRYFTEDQHRIILGSILGDGSLRFEGANKRKGRRENRHGHLRVGHGMDQREYCEWKADCLNASTYIQKNGSVHFKTVNSQEFERYLGIPKKKAGVGMRDIPQNMVDRLDLKSIAIWYMDDGTHVPPPTGERGGVGRYSISCKNLSSESLDRILQKLSDLGIPPTYHRVQDVGISWTGDAARRFIYRVSRYIHTSMRYKVYEPAAQPFDWHVESMTPQNTLYTARVVETRVSDRRGMESLKRTRYDIGVEGNHNYFVDNVLVHNSFGDPRTLPGGKALEYSTSQQAEIKNKEHTGKDDLGHEVVLYNEHNLKVTKNKVGGPFRESKFELIRTPQGVMPEGWVDQAKAFAAFGLKIGVCEGAPSSFTVDGVRGSFRGAPALTEWAVENPDEYYKATLKIIEGYRRRWGLAHDE